MLAIAGKDFGVILCWRKVYLNFALKNNEHIDLAVAVGVQYSACRKRFLVPIGLKSRHRVFSQIWEGQFPTKVGSERLKKCIRYCFNGLTECDLVVVIFHVSTPC